MSVTYIGNNRNFSCFSCIHLQDVEKGEDFCSIQHHVTHIDRVYPAVQRPVEMCCNGLRWIC